MCAEIEINGDFKKAFEIVDTTIENLFITGRAGTGKSTFLKYLVDNTMKRVVVLAFTGVAALNVEGQTIHSFFKFPHGVTVQEAKASALSRKNTHLFELIDVIIIDEISMVRADLLDCINVFLKTILRTDKPFGGKQMVFIGDLYQIPPIVNNEERLFFEEVYSSQYFFDAHAMRTFAYSIIEFGKIYRQNDKKFIDLLNRVRINSVIGEDIQEINSRCENIIEDKGHIYLVTTNAMAETINKKKLAEIPDKLFKFQAKIEGDFEKESYPAEITLRLKKGAQVMFLVNDKKKQWVNGTIGTIARIGKKEILVNILGGGCVEAIPHEWELPKYVYNAESKSIEKEIVGSFTQIPLRLAWAVTIHKSQGKTFDKVIIDVGNGTFATGQLYVALSRCTTLEGIKIKTPIQKHHIFTDWKIRDYLKRVLSPRV